MNGWAALVLSSFAPADDAGGLVKSGDDIDWGAAWSRFTSTMSAKGRLGAYAGLVICIFAPLLAMGRFATIARVSIEERARALDVLLAHRSFAIRELTLLLKIVACMAIFRSSAARERSGYDRPASPKVRLPMLSTEAA
ncbi:hypothetical protein [Sandaracinus amylolyticus]|uniref:hypothetical protein n=1 Tax=Sandaracinus amylolyticus TaxID=927083 RepID=UPI001F45FB93|nr:hypothetical protein [Sandaracinus amylolyticus]UJR80888.1 Hypothetical protein I5071_29380 [Sandaracinus amylolyticus]